MRYRYRPVLGDGQVAPLSWPVVLYRVLNHIAWPLEDGVSRRLVHLEALLIFLGFLVFCEHNEVDFHYLIANRHDLDKMLTGMPTYLILVEMQIRGFQLAVKKNQFKQLLQRFYREIYVREEESPELFGQIQSQMRGIRLNSIVYLMALFNFLVVPVQNIIYHRREMLYKQVYPFDNTQMRYFIPLLGLNFWVGVIVTSMLFGELNVMGELMMHLNARYVQLGQDLRQAARQLINEEGPSERLAAKYRKALTGILRRNVSLNKFGAEMEQEFSFRIFVMFAFSAALLCAMSFKAYTNPWGNIVYIVWFTAKFMELLAFGTLGSILYKTTDDLCLQYYLGDWEQIVYRSPNSAENVLLMKMVTLAIEVNSKPFFLTGLKYFRVTLAAVIKILQGAFSYFTFLTSMR